MTRGSVSSQWESRTPTNDFYVEDAASGGRTTTNPNDNRQGLHACIECTYVDCENSIPYRHSEKVCGLYRMRFLHEQKVDVKHAGIGLIPIQRSTGTSKAVPVKHGSADYVW